MSNDQEDELKNLINEMTTPERVAFLGMIQSVVAVTGEESAKAHLETAIWLWFQQGNDLVPCEPSAIDTLAVAAQGTLHQVARELHKPPSQVATAMMKNEPLRRAQNYFKHGTYTGKPKGRKHVANIGDMTELILADNVGTFNRLFGYSTPLLDIFLLWYSWVFPASKIRIVSLEVELRKRIKIDGLAGLPRTRFYQTLIPFLVEIANNGKLPVNSHLP